MPSNKSQVYQKIQKKRIHARIYRTARSSFLKKRAPLTIQNAKEIWQQGCLSPGRLAIKIQSWKYVMDTFPCTKEAKEFIEKKTVFQPSGKGYYRQFDRKIYHRAIFDLAFHLQQDTKLDIYDVKLLWYCTNDGRGPSKVKFRTLSFVLNEMDLTTKANAFLKDKVSTSFDRLARRAKRKSATPVRRSRRRKRKSQASRKKCPKFKSPLNEPPKAKDDGVLSVGETQLDVPTIGESDLDDSILDDDLDFDNFDEADVELESLLDPDDLPDNPFELTEDESPPKSTEVDEVTDHKDEAMVISDLEDNEQKNDNSFSIMSPLKTYWDSLFSTPISLPRKRPATEWPNPKRQRTAPEEPILDLDSDLTKQPTLDLDADLPPEKAEPALDLDAELTPSETKDSDLTKRPIIDLDADLSLEAEPVLDLDAELTLEQESRSWRFSLPSIAQALYCDEGSRSVYASDNSGTVYQISFDGNLLKKIEFESPVVAIFHDDADLHFIDDDQNVFRSKLGLEPITRVFSLENTEFIQNASGHSGKIALSTVEGDVIAIDADGSVLWTKTTQKSSHGFFIAAEPDGIFHASGNFLQKYDWEGEVQWTYESSHNILDACMNKMYVYTSNGRRIDRFSGESSWHLDPSEFSLQASYSIAEMDGEVFYEHFLQGVLRVNDGKVSHITQLENRPLHLASVNDQILIAASDVIQFIDLKCNNPDMKKCSTSDVEILRVET